MDRIELVTQLIDGAHYREAERLLQTLLFPATDAVPPEALAEIVELCRACDDEHSRMREHWQAATVGAVAESRLRARLSALLGRHLVTPSASAGPPGNLDAPAPAAACRGFRVHCLGPLRIHHGDRVLGPVPNRRAREVFCYLLAHRDRPTPREVLMELFWPGAAPPSARNSLNVAVHGLRRFLRSADGDDGHVRFHTDAYQLDPDLDLWLDLDEFRNRLAKARAARGSEPAAELAELEAAEGVYQGPLFEDEPYAEWLAGLRRSTQDSYVELLERLARRHADAGDLDARARVLRKVVAVEPEREVTHRELMRCYAESGQHNLALRQYDDCRRMLREVLDLEPGPETRRVYERIRDRQPA